MIKKIGASIVGLILLALASPMFIYWWGLSNLETAPVPSQLKLTATQELDLWKNEKETGTPRINKATPYGYILYFFCHANKGLHSKECMSEYPGLRISAFAIRKQVAKQVSGKGNTIWQVTWIAYTIWVTQNWNANQILSTYYEAYNT